MDSKNGKKFKKCWICGKTITDEKKIIRLCPKCQGKGETGGVTALAVLLMAAGGIVAKELKKR